MRIPRRILLAAAVVASMLIHVSAASAQYATPVRFECGGFNSGGRDAAGTHYMACGAKVVITPLTGAARTATTGATVHHVAPSPDGAFLYAADSSGLRRFKRTSATAYALDTSFQPRRPSHWKATYRMTGFGVATDAYGNIYFSNGWGATPALNEILKYRPDGTLVTWFGEYGEAGAVGANPGHFRPNTGMAVSADGSRIWVADQNNQRVQFFDRRPHSDHYAFAGMWSGEGTAWSGQLGAVYDVAIDPWDRVYVTQTTTKNIWRLDRDGTNPVIVGHHRGSDAWQRPHTVSVDGRGRVYVGEWSQRFDPIGAVPPIPAVGPEPRADAQAPVLRGIELPAETTQSTVTLRVDASDDIAVAELRLADESGNWEPWQPYRAELARSLTTGFGTKLVYVQVRDVVGRESESLIARTVFKAVPDTTAPTLTVSAPASSPTRSVQLTVNTSDAVGVTKLRIAGDDGSFGPWLAWANGSRHLAHDLGSDTGTHVAYVQVQDAAHNGSDTAVVRVAIVPPTVAPAPAPGNATPGGQVVGGGGVVRDRVAPRIRRLLAPARSCSRIVRLRLVAADNRGVRFVRIANENGRYGRWQRYRGSLRHVLTRGATRKLVTVQVRDASGNVSRAASRRLLVVRCR